MHCMLRNSLAVAIGVWSKVHFEPELRYQLAQGPNTLPSSISTNACLLHESNFSEGVLWQVTPGK